MVAAQIYEIVFIPFQKSVKFCFFWWKMGGSWGGEGALGALGAIGVLLGRLGALGGFGGWDFFRGAIACLR